MDGSTWNFWYILHIKMKSQVVFLKSSPPRWPPECNVYIKLMLVHNFVLDWDINFNFFYYIYNLPQRHSSYQKLHKTTCWIAENGWKFQKTAKNCQKQWEIYSPLTTFKATFLYHFLAQLISCKLKLSLCFRLSIPP